MADKKGTRARRLALWAVAAGAAGLAVVNRLRALDLHVVRSKVPHGRTLLIYSTRDAAGEPIRVMRTAGVFQSATYLEPSRRMSPVFAYYRAFGRLFLVAPQTRRILAVGGGGFAFPKLVAAEHPGVSVDVVELDPAVVEAARRWFFLDEASELARAGGGEMRAICAEGRSYLEREAAGAGYDAVVLDAFVGSAPVRGLATVEAAMAVRRALAPDGIMLANVVSHGGGRDLGFLRSVVTSYREAFSYVWVVPATDGDFAGEDNYLVVASDAGIDLPDAIPYDADFLVAPLHD